MVTMKNTVEFLKTQRVKEFTLTEIEALALIPWAKNGRTIRKCIEADIAGENLLEARAWGVDSQRRYSVSRKGLLKYLQTYGPALMATIRKPKQSHGRKKTGTIQKRT